MITNENTPFIQTERLLLRKFVEDDASALLSIVSDIDVNAFLPWFPLQSKKEAQTFLKERFLAYYDKLSAYRYAICRKEDDLPIGYVWLSNTESYDLGYGLDKKFWHNGFVTEAAAAVVQRIKNAGYPYITATHDKNNMRSGAVMKKLGMQYRYSYVEQWQPKNVAVTFRMFQLNFDGDAKRTYMEYWNHSQNHFIEENI